MQINNIVMALAGSERIFNLLDEKPETDDGYVTLVRAKKENEAELQSAASVPECGLGSMCIRQTVLSTTLS